MVLHNVRLVQSLREMRLVITWGTVCLALDLDEDDEAEGIQVGWKPRHVWRSVW